MYKGVDKESGGWKLNHENHGRIVTCFLLNNLDLKYIFIRNILLLIGSKSMVQKKTLKLLILLDVTTI